jgi:hypothetical protein
MAYGRRLRMALLRQSQVPIPPKPDECNENSNGNGNGNGEKPKSKPKPKMRTVDEMMLIVEAVIEAAKRAEPWAVEHVAQRIDGKVREQVEVTTNTNVKVRYETYEEVRAALLEEGINVDQLPMLEDMRPPEERN